MPNAQKTVDDADDDGEGNTDAGAESNVPPERRHPLADEDTTVPSKTDSPTDFLHPALRNPQRPIWVAADPLGLGLAEVKAMREEGIEATVGGARLEENGSVIVWGVGDGGK